MKQVYRLLYNSMTREEKCILAIEKGFTYDKITGKVYGIRGGVVKSIKNKYIDISIIVDGIRHRLYGHQFAYYWVYKKIVEQIDHINRVRDDNRICNLREVTRQQNSWNTDSKGAYKKRNKWESKIMKNGNTEYLGVYDTEQEAREAYLKAKQKYHIV